MATMVSTAQRQESLTAHPFRDFPIGRCPSADQSCTVTAYNFDDSNHNFPLPPPLDGLWWSWHGPCPWKLAINIFRHHEGCRRGGGECANGCSRHKTPPSGSRTWSGCRRGAISWGSFAVTWTSSAGAVMPLSWRIGGCRGRQGSKVSNLSVHKMRLGSEWHEQRFSGCKGSSVHGRNLGTSARCSYG
jgi:hypothetical protein